MPIRLCDGNQLYNIVAARRLASIILDFKPDIIIGVNQRPLLYAILAQKFSRWRACVISVFHSDISHITGLKANALQMIYNPIFQLADAVIFVCESQRTNWISKGLRAKKTCVIYNGVDESRFEPSIMAEFRKVTRARLGINPEEIVLGLCARMYREKNHVQLIEAIKIMRNRGHNVKAVFVGDGPLRPLIEARIAEEIDDNSIILVGNQNDVRPFLAAFDIGCLCSTAETFSLAAVETMMAARPMVMSDVGGASEMVWNGKTGHLFPVSSTNHLVAAIESLLDSDRCTVMGEAARKWMLDEFTLKKMVSGYREFLLTCLP